MQYEIRKRGKIEPDLWYTVAWCDMWDWAWKTADALSVCLGGEFAVFYDGKRIEGMPGGSI